MVTTKTSDFTGSVAAIKARTDAAGAAETDYRHEEVRMLVRLLSEGALTHDAFKVRPASPASMNVRIGSGSAEVDKFVVHGDDPGQEAYLVRLDDTEIARAIDPADGAQARTDEIWLFVADDNYDSGGLGLPRIGYQVGDLGGAAPGPNAAWTAAVKLATIAVGAGVSEIQAGDITDHRVQAVFEGGISAGEVRMHAASALPSGWVECNGQALSRTTYARLFAAIGTAYGPGDGATTFNVPNLAGRFPVGLGTLGADTYVLGDTGGEARHALTLAELASHTHTGPSHTHPAGTLATGNDTHDHTVPYKGTPPAAHAHLAANPGGANENLAGAPSPGSSNTNNQDSTTDQHNHSVTGSTGSGGTGSTGPAGSGSAHENRPPYLGLRFIIKT